MTDPKILVGDCLEQMAHIESQSVQTCVTSPPYWGLRDYGTASWEGGDDECAHEGKFIVMKLGIGARSPKQRSNKGSLLVSAGDCKCGAVRVDNQIGLEETHNEYVAKMVKVFAEVRRVLKDDGTLWLNLGDSYASSGKGRNGDGTSNVDPDSKQATSAGTTMGILPPSMPDGLKPKDLIGIPWRVAFALQADGWYLRQDIIWAKPNPMPESVKDRCTKSHEYLFLLSKSPKYYFDSESMREKGVMSKGDSAGSVQQNTTKTHGVGGGNSGLNLAKEKLNAELNEKGFTTRNKRDVWTINVKPFKGAHFATMPESLVEPCVLAGSREGDIVFDPFLGSGTVAVVAERHRRNWIGCELNPDYAAIAEARITSAQPEQSLFETGVTK